MALPIVQQPRAASLPRREDGSADVTPAVVGPGDMLRVKNNDSHHYEFPWDSVPHRLPGNGEGILPFEAVANWFGDPRAGATVGSTRDQRGLVGFIPDRETEVRRLGMKYGNAGLTPDEHVYPNVEVYDLDGNRVLTVLDDPSGQAINPAPAPTIADANALQDQLRRLQQQLDAVLAHNAEQAKNAQLPTETGEDPENPDDTDREDAGDRLPTDE